MSDDESPSTFEGDTNGESHNDSAEQAEKDSGLRITISATTTCVVEPLRRDGYPDYLGAVDHLQSQGATPWNNYAVELISAFGPSDINKSIRHQYFSKLGIDTLPEDGDYLIDFVDYLEETYPNNSEELAEKYYDGWFTTRPWQRDEFPELAAWHQHYSKRLDQLYPTARHKTFYVPAIAESEKSTALIYLLPVTTNQARSGSRWLLERAMLRLGEGNLEGAWQDVMAVRRMARMVGQGPLTIDVLVGHAVNSLTYQAITPIVDDPRLTKEQAMQFRGMLAIDPPRPDPLSIVNSGERLVCLDGICGMVRGGPNSLQGMSWAASGGMSDVFDTFLAEATDDVDKAIANSIEEVRENLTPDEIRKRQLKQIFDAIDWDLVLSTCNEYFDRLHAVSEIEDAEARDAKLESLLAEIESAGDFESLAKLPKNVPDENRKAFSRHIGCSFMNLFVPAVGATIRSGRRADTQDVLVDLTLALAEYRIDHGEYPRRLDELIPGHLHESPTDAFSHAPIRYLRVGEGYRVYSIGFNREDEGGDGPYTDGDGDDITMDVGIGLEALP